MSNTCARAVVLGIAALFDIADRAEQGPLAPSLELRSLLALLHAASDGNREPYVSFWKAVRNPGLSGQSDTTNNYARFTTARVQIHGIARTFGMQPQSTVFQDVMDRLRSQQRAALDPESGDATNTPA